MSFGPSQTPATARPNFQELKHPKLDLTGELLPSLSSKKGPDESSTQLSPVTEATKSSKFQGMVAGNITVDLNSGVTGTVGNSSLLFQSSPNYPIPGTPIFDYRRDELPPPAVILPESEEGPRECEEGDVEATVENNIDISVSVTPGDKDKVVVKQSPTPPSKRVTKKRGCPPATTKRK